MFILRVVGIDVQKVECEQVRSKDIEYVIMKYTELQTSLVFFNQICNKIHVLSTGGIIITYSR